jgi:ribonuclease-3
MAERHLEERLGVRFRDPRLLQTALTHKSAVNERPEAGIADNERLEFLGDAVLGAVVAEDLYRAFPEATEGALTVMRAELVRQSGLARWARAFDLGDSMVLGRGEDQRGGRDRDPLLASAFEALVGALYLDQGYEAALQFIAPLVAASLPSFSPSQPARDPKSELQYRLQARTGALPLYRVISVEGPEHRPLFTVEVQAGDGIVGTGVGSSKQAAEQEAARNALAVWARLESEDLFPSEPLESTPSGPVESGFREPPGPGVPETLEDRPCS